MTGSFPLTIETPDAIARQVLNVMFYGLPLERAADLPRARERRHGGRHPARGRGCTSSPIGCRSCWWATPRRSRTSSRASGFGTFEIVELGSSISRPSTSSSAARGDRRVLDASACMHFLRRAVGRFVRRRARARAARARAGATRFSASAASVSSPPAASCSRLSRPEGHRPGRGHRAVIPRSLPRCRQPAGGRARDPARRGRAIDFPGFNFRLARRG